MSTAEHTSQDEIAAELASVKRLLSKLLLAQRPTNPTADFTISSWCRKHGYSRAFWYVLKARGRTPRTVGEGHSLRITQAADQAWEVAEAERAATKKETT